MTKRNFAGIGSFALMLMIARAGLAAPILSFDNAEADVERSYQVGETILIDLWISGLDPGSGAALGAFDLDMGYDGIVTDYQSTDFSDALDDYDFFGLTAAESGGNALNTTGVSLAFDLSTQAPAFKLFTLEFTAAALGTSVLALDSVLLSDAFAIELDATTYAATINVEAPATVPEPATLSLMLLGLLALAWRRPLSKLASASTV